MKPKDFFPNLPDTPFEDLKEVLVETKKMQTKQANNVKKLVKTTAEEMCAQFAIEKREDDWNVLYGLIDAYGQKHAMPKFLEYLENQKKEIEEFKTKFFPEKK